MSELPESRLKTTDEKGNRVYLFPEDITGFWKTRRRAFYYFLIFLYLFLPWIYIDGKQWVLLDIPKRTFRIFGFEFFGHDGPLLFFLLAGFILTIAFITSIWGRVWCGWACPQTVFIDAIYRNIEKLVEGKARARKALAAGPWTFEKVWKRALKWLLYILVSLHIVHSFLGYFVGTHKLFWITMTTPTEHWALFLTMLVMTGIILLDFGWFREQFCIIACPYGRFQSVAMDDNSMIVAYDSKRGEPRRAKGLPKDQEGSCIDCNRCVKACPTGIDIREGTQLECIACTMCIDACDEIMVKLKQPTGLIRYTTENELKGVKKPKIQARSVIYLLLLSALATGLYFSLSLRQQLQVQIFKSSKEAAYQEIKLKDGDKRYINHFRLKAFIASVDDTKYKIELKDNNLGLKLTVPEEEFVLRSQNYEVPVFIEFDKSILTKGQRFVSILVKNIDTDKIIIEKEVRLVGPFE
ncbi:MAG: cytochrome c oxidase accessory protein CcoG [Bdellovibrionota bacterium]|nr:cytochrome c oxidase accessory protein CcoG [Bdellovibrionota bacterium]